MKPINKKIYIALITLFMGMEIFESNLNARDGGRSSNSGNRGGSRGSSVSHGNWSRSHTSSPSRTSGSRSVSRPATPRSMAGSTRHVNVVTPADRNRTRQNSPTWTRQGNRAPHGTRQGGNRSTNRSNRYHGNRYHNGYGYSNRRYRHNGRYYRHSWWSYWNGPRFSFWLAYPLAYQYYYTHFQNSCRVFNDTDYELTIFTGRTPLTLPSGQGLYLPCNSRATIESFEFGRITTGVFDQMVITDDGKNLIVE